MSSETARHICCPGCGAREGYRLGDGRKKCRRCGKKYSPRLLRSRLPAKTLKQIALYFWLAAPVATVSAELCLNPKTVGRHYELMRQGIFEGALSSPWPGGQDSGGEELALMGEDRSEFALLVGPRDTLVVALYAGPVEEAILLPARADSVGYRWHFSDKRKLPAPMFETACHVYLVEDGPGSQALRWRREVELFAGLAFRSCRLTRCRSVADSQRLTEEIVFRFNHRNNPGVTAILYGLLNARPLVARGGDGER